MKYQVILADPPWSYRQVQHGGAKAGYTSSAESFYPTMSLNDICGMKGMIEEIADPDQCILFIWIPGPLLPDGLRVISEWGFTYKRDAFQWNKVMVNPGYYTMTQFETCYAATMGRIPRPRGARNIRQYIEEKRTKHSRKPLEVHERIDAMFPEQRKIELFARPPHPSGWDVWGNQAERWWRQ